MKNLFSNHKTEGFLDARSEPGGQVRSSHDAFLSHLEDLSIEEWKAKQHSADRTCLTMSITFNVYREGQGVERTMPSDLLPRIIPAKQWNSINRGGIPHTAWPVTTTTGPGAHRQTPP